MNISVLLTPVLLLCASVAGAQSVFQDADLTGTRPNEGGEPEQVALRLGVLDIAEIDDRQQVFTADIYLEISWRDPGLSKTNDAIAGLRTVALGISGIRA